MSISDLCSLRASNLNIGQFNKMSTSFSSSNENHLTKLDNNKLFICKNKPPNSNVLDLIQVNLDKFNSNKSSSDLNHFSYSNNTASCSINFAHSSLPSNNFTIENNNKPSNRVKSDNPKSFDNCDSLNNLNSNEFNFFTSSYGHRQLNNPSFYIENSSKINPYFSNANSNVSNYCNLDQNSNNCPQDAADLHAFIQMNSYAMAAFNNNHHHHHHHHHHHSTHQTHQAQQPNHHLNSNLNINKLSSDISTHQTNSIQNNIHNLNTKLTTSDEMTKLKTLNKIYSYETPSSSSPSSNSQSSCSTSNSPQNFSLNEINLSSSLNLSSFTSNEAGNNHDNLSKTNVKNVTIDLNCSNSNQINTNNNSNNCNTNFAHHQNNPNNNNLTNSSTNNSANSVSPNTNIITDSNINANNTSNTSNATNNTANNAANNNINTINSSNINTINSNNINSNNINSSNDLNSKIMLNSNVNPGLLNKLTNPNHVLKTPATSGSNNKRSRRRVATIAQRRAANIRERKRMQHLNKAFDKLRTRVPTFQYEKRLSRIETLRLAIMYIQFMSSILNSETNSLTSSSNTSNLNLDTISCKTNEVYSALNKNNSNVSKLNPVETNLIQSKSSLTKSSLILNSFETNNLINSKLLNNRNINLLNNTNINLTNTTLNNNTFSNWSNTPSVYYSQ